MSSEQFTLWNNCLNIIKDNVSETAFKTWFLPIVPLSFRDKVFTIQVPSHFFYEHLEEKYVDLLRQTLYRVCGEGTQLMYQVVVENQNKITVDVEATVRPSPLI